MAKIIFEKLQVDKEILNDLAAEFECTQSCVYNSLAYRNRSKLAENIRSRARELGATIVRTIRA